MSRLALLLSLLLLRLQPAISQDTQSDGARRAAQFASAVFATDVQERGAAKPFDVRCRELRKENLSDLPDAPTVITDSRELSGLDGKGRVCSVQGNVSPSVGFDILLPETWNGKFMHVGCGGGCGVLYTPMCRVPIKKGYACLVSDMGHRSSVDDALWAFNNLQAEVDWGYRATHVATLAGKAIAAKFYSQGPNYSYFFGCSTGGRQGLIEAQRFPWDFDGIVIGAPAINVTSIYMHHIWNAQSVTDKDGKNIFVAEDLKKLNAYVTQKCDGLDGIVDGVISNPFACPFKPEELSCETVKPGQWCLNGQQLDALRRLYAGPSTPEGVPLSPGGPLVGSELEWIPRMLGGGVWAGLDYLKDVPIERYGAELVFRFANFMPAPGPHWTYKDFDFSKDYKRLGLTEMLYASNNPDLRQFKQHGGKIVGFNGLNDEPIPPRYFIDYYQSVQKLMGDDARDISDFFRLYLVPGMDHCTGGVGAYSIDFLGALEQWVEAGEAPTTVSASRPKDHSTRDIIVDKDTLLKPEQTEFRRTLTPYAGLSQHDGGAPR